MVWMGWGRWDDLMGNNPPSESSNSLIKTNDVEEVGVVRPGVMVEEVMVAIVVMVMVGAGAV